MSDEYPYKLIWKCRYCNRMEDQEFKDLKDCAEEYTRYFMYNTVEMTHARTHRCDETHFGVFELLAIESPNI